MTLDTPPVFTAGGVLIHAGSPAKVFDTKYAMPTAYRTYDVSPDGQRFLRIKEGTAEGSAPLPSMIVVLNRLEELRPSCP